MNLINAVVLGIVEGITEFLPISSTAHLIIVSHFLQLTQSSFITFFEIAIQSGAIIAVIFLYYKYILENLQKLKYIFISFIPTAFIGFMFHSVIKNYLFQTQILILITLFVLGIVFILVEYLISKQLIILHKDLSKLTVKQALIIGLCQASAIIPGVSRAGAVMLSMMILGYKRKDSALYSFLLAIPTILSATLFDAIKTDFTTISNLNNIFTLSVGFIFSLTTAFIVIRWFITFLQHNTLVYFGIYRIILVILILIASVV